MAWAPPCTATASKCTCCVPRPTGASKGASSASRERAQKTVVGEFHCGQRYNYVLPFDHRIPFEIVIPRGAGVALAEAAGQPRPAIWRANRKARRAEVMRAPGRTPQRARLEEPDRGCRRSRISPPRPRLPRGRVIEVLGRRDEFGVDVEIIIRKFHLPHRFPAGGSGRGERHAAVHSRARTRRPARFPLAAHRDH